MKHATTSRGYKSHQTGQKTYFMAPCFVIQAGKGRLGVAAGMHLNLRGQSSYMEL